MILVFVERWHTPQNGKRTLCTEAPEILLGPVRRIPDDIICKCQMPIRRIPCS